MLFHSVNGVSNGQLLSSDRALNYGDGLFTTAKISDGVIAHQSLHIERLKSGCQALNITSVDFTWLAAYIRELAATHASAVLKVLISAGEGGRGYSRVGVNKANVIVSIHAFPEHYHTLAQQGIHLGVADFSLGLSAPQLSGIKHLNRLEQVLIRQELDKKEEDDLLVLDINKHIVEASSGNVFYQIADNWFTPKISTAGVNGIMRQIILQQAPEVKVVEDTLTRLTKVQAMFVCNCVAGIVPVKQFNHSLLDMTAVAKFKGKLTC